MSASELDRLKRLEEAFHNALERADGEERELFLTAIEATDPENVRELRQLLASDSRIAATAPERHAVSLPRFGSWQALKVLGRGGMGTVYLAERADGAFEMRAAVKVVPLALASSEMEERFVRERHILALLNHPRVARLLDGGVSEGGIPYLVMEFINGEHIDAYAAKHNLDRAARIRLILQVLTALEYVHGERVLHRDLKPANVLIDAAGRIKLVDFGIARLMESEVADSLTRSGIFTFTPDYASPEQIRGEVLTPASDIYSVGVLLAKVLTGKLPGESELNHATGADLSAVISKALQKDPGARYLSAAEMAGDLHRILAGKPPLAREKKRRLLFAAIGLSILLTSAGAWLALGGREDRQILAPVDAASPAISKDARWIAWVSQAHIWLSAGDGRPAHQITWLPGHDARPSLSADGSVLVYEHYAPDAATPILYKEGLRAGVPAGPAIALWKGYRPRISPDAQKVAFEAFGFSGADFSVPRRIEVGSLADPRRQPALVQDPPQVASWIWKPDSSGLLAFGHRSLYDSNAQNRLELYSLDLRNGAPKAIRYWPGDDEDVLFCGTTSSKGLALLAFSGRDSTWFEVSPDLTTVRMIRNHLPRTVACGLANGNHLVLFVDQTKRTIWRLPGDVAGGRLTANAASSTNLAVDHSLSASLDGKWLTWSDSGQSYLRQPSGRIETIVSSALMPAVSADGTSLVYQDGQVHSRYLLLSLPELRVSRSFEMVSILWGLSKNGDRALTIGLPSTPRSIATVETRTRVQRTILVDPTRDLYLATFSPDEKWVLFTAEGPLTPPTIYIAPLDLSRVTPPSEWIEVAQGDYPVWGGTNERIYYLAGDGSVATVALRPSATKLLIGRSQTVFAPRAPWQISALPPGTFRIAATRDALYFPLGVRRVSALLLHR